MKNSFGCITVKAGLGMVLLLLTGCASSTPSRHYMLNPLRAEGNVQAQEPCPSIGVGPIRLPEYLSRMQIVTRTSTNEVTLSYSDLWAESLSESVPRLLAENLSQLVCTKEVVFFPWRPSHVPDIRVEVEVLKMDGALVERQGWHARQPTLRPLEVRVTMRWSKRKAGHWQPLVATSPVR